MRTFPLPLCSLLLGVLASPAVEAKDEVWWSLRPLSKPVVPEPRAQDKSWVRTPIDALILAKLREKGFSPAPEANRRTLIRRLTFDLIGLPPTPEEVAAFEKDTAANAYESVVDRLLKSPHYGERWARHWMDVAHFAETHGHDQDRVRPDAWPYRDYLIESFNADTPYPRFVREQIAADVLFPEETGLTPALGFLAAGPWDESSLRDIREDSIDREAGRYLDRDDIVTTVAGSFLSVTAHCARCHDHKFDPILQEDYYALQAVFAGVGRGVKKYDADPAVAKKRAETNAFAAVGSGVALRDLPALRLVYVAAKDFEPDGSHKPSTKPRVVRLLKRGDIRKPGDEVEPGALSCLPKLPGRFELADASDEGSRRAALANWLTDRENPLFWRSIVNRVWHYHFGRGICDTPNDLGKMGGKPTHPELLDWLAVEFRDGGGSLKKLHRLIVTSAVYRESSRHEPKFAAVDGDNHFLWRAPRSRLDAEQVRDAILQVSGRLDPRRGGPSDQQFRMTPGVHVTPDVHYMGFAWDRPEGHRRSVYRFVFRTLPDPLVDCLDGADASQSTPARNTSVTAPQALSLLNNEFVLAHAKALAVDLEKRSPERESHIALACERLWARPPTADEKRELLGYAKKHGMPAMCRLLLNSNEFLFVD